MGFKRILILSIFVSLISSCFLSKPIKTGDVYYAEMQYTVAAETYKTEIETEKDEAVRAKKTFLIAECYRLAFNTIDAERYYQKAVDLDYKPISNYYYAEMLKANGKYSDAIKQFQIYEQRDPSNDDVAESEIKACTKALAWMKKPANYRVNNLEDINSDAFDYAPQIYENGALVFTSDRKEATGEIYGWTGRKHSDLFIAASNGKGGFLPPQSFSPVINSDYNDGTGSFTKALNEIYFSRCNTDAPSNGYCKIYVSTKDGNGVWSTPQELNLFDDSVTVSQPFITPDGKELYVSANAKDGYGGKDIYVCDRTSDGGWSTPVNLGPSVNSPGDEVFPVISDDGKLYFSSNGHESMGGLDIFYSKKQNGKWGNPVNMQYPINTSSDDFGLIFEKLKPGEGDSVRSKGYLTSSRPGGKGDDDIYEFILPRIKVCLLNVLVQVNILENPHDPNSKVVGQKPLPDADVTISEQDASGNQVVSSLQSLKADSTGKVILKVDCEKSFKITAGKENYFNKSDVASTNGFKKIDADTSVAYAKLALSRIFMDTFVNIPNIYYDLAMANIRPDAARVLDNVVIPLLKENPTLKIEMGSHTDSRASFKYNEVLSQKRAQSAVDYLVAHGIEKDRLVAKGYSFSMLTNNCGPGVPCTEEEHQANRRTTFRVIKDKKPVNNPVNQ